MEQRPLRLGDIVDDYCPRERRITNHVIVAIVEDAIRQTRCSTCDVEHVYKQAREPRRRRKDDVGGNGVIGTLVPPRPVDAPDETTPAAAPSVTTAHPALAPPPASVDAPVVASADAEDAPTGAAAHDEGWPAHRRLIRATLPRVEGEPPAARPIPEFTMHQRAGRGPHGHGPRHGGWEPNGNTLGRHGGRPGGGPRDPNSGGQPGGGGGRRHRGRGKRSR